MNQTRRWEKFPQIFVSGGCRRGPTIVTVCDQWAHPKYFCPRGNLRFQARHQIGNSCRRQFSCDYGQTSRRLFIYNRYIHIAIDCHGQRTRNWCCRQCQHIWVFALGTQGLALGDAKAMLFVNNDQSQITVFHIV